jgi:hypothetical protein
MRSLADLMLTDFEPRRAETFRLRAPAPARELDLELTEVRRLGQNGWPGGAFSLLFRAPSGPFPQAIYAIAHPELGTLDLFIVPIVPTASGNGYEAICT